MVFKKSRDNIVEYIQMRGPVDLLMCRITLVTVLNVVDFA
jgi:hypothetical protein